MLEKLSPSIKESVQKEFQDNDELTVQLWSELQGSDPELCSFIGSEVLRLFPDDNLARPRVTRLAVELIQLLSVNELSSRIGIA